MNPLPREGALAILRNRRGLITSVQQSSNPREEKVNLVRVEYTDTAGTLEDSVIWEREVDARVLEPTALPDLYKPPMKSHEFDALVRATRWTALHPFVDPYGEGILERMPISAPFHGAIQVEDFQMVPLVKALAMPRVSLFLCDDVGLGKTIEAGLIISELILRRRVRRIMVISPASLCTQWQQEMKDKFSLDFDIIDRDSTYKLRKKLGMDASPWRSFSRIIASYYYLKQEDVLEQFRISSRPDNQGPHLPWDLLVVDEAHNLTPSPFGEESDLSKMLQKIVPYFEHKIFLTATPHNGHTRSFTGLLERLDPVRFSQRSEITPAEKARIHEVVVRRLKREINESSANPRFSKRHIESIYLDLSSGEKSLAEAYRAFREKIRELTRSRSRNEQLSGNFAVEVLGKRLLSCPVAFADSWYRYLDGMKDDDTADVSEVRQAEKVVREETGDDGEAESRYANAAKTVGSWLKNYMDSLNAEIEEVNRALAGLGLHNTRNNDGAYEGSPVYDCRFDAMISLVEKNLRRDGAWRDDERLVVFTEYKTTLDYLQKCCLDKYDDDGSIQVLYGNMPMKERDAIKDAFNDPEDNIRVLIATDTASEGLNLQETARYLLHYDVPWNPSRLEQRNGRLDRHGQGRDVVVHHFSTDDESDMAFLGYVVGKIDTIREDLGSVEEIFDAAIRRCLVEGDNHSTVIKDVDLLTEKARGRAEIPGLSEQGKTDSIGEREIHRLAALKAELDLDPGTLRETLGIIMGLGNGMPVFDERDDGRVRLMNNNLSSEWPSLVNDHLRRDIGKNKGALPALAFDPELFMDSKNGLPVFRPRKDTVLMHLAHPLYHHALSLYSRMRYPGTDNEMVSRWTIRCGGVPAGADALVMLTVEELAVNEMREMFHHWVRTFVYPVRGDKLLDPLPHEPASASRLEAPCSIDSLEKAHNLWLDVEDDVKGCLKKMAQGLTEDLKESLAREKDNELARERDRFQSRQGELSKLIEDTTVKRLEKEIDELKAMQGQGILFDQERYLNELIASQKEKEEEVKRRKQHYEELRDLLERERERILKQVIPKRHTLRGNAQIYPVAVEIRFPEVRP